MLVATLPPHPELARHSSRRVVVRRCLRVDNDGSEPIHRLIAVVLIVRRLGMPAHGHGNQRRAINKRSRASRPARP